MVWLTKDWYNASHNAIKIINIAMQTSFVSGISFKAILAFSK